MLEVLIGVGTLTSRSSFDTQSLQFVTMIELKKVDARRFVTFYISLRSSIQCQLSYGIRSYFTQGNVFRKMGQMYLSIVEKYISREVTHNLYFFLMNSTPSKSFSVDFIHFKYCFQFGIEQIDV